jgi:hypothetical protein
MRPFLVPEPPGDRLTRGLLWASKTDPNLVCVCSRWSLQTQIAYGYFVCFTALAAFGAAWCTMTTVNAPVLLVPLIALAWSAFVFFLDREITGSLDKRALWIRPILALVISATVAIPVELSIFQGRVDQVLQRDYLDTNKQQMNDRRAGEAKLQEERARLARKLDREEQDVAQWGNTMDAEAVGRAGAGRTGQAGTGAAYRNAQDQQEKAIKAVAQTRQEAEQLDRSMNDERKRLEKEFERGSVPKVTDFVTRFEGLERVKAESASLNFLSWLITLTLMMIELTPALMKFMKWDSDYDTLVRRMMDEFKTRMDAIAELKMASVKKDPMTPSFTTVDHFAETTYGPLGGPAEDKENTSASDDDSEEGFDGEDEAA